MMTKDDILIPLSESEKTKYGKEEFALSPSRRRYSQTYGNRIRS